MRDILLGYDIYNIIIKNLIYNNYNNFIRKAC